MNKYKYEVTIQAATANEAEEKLRAASALMERLQVREIKKLADVVQNDPVKTALAKRALGL
ncbi:hypothetical protein [Dawidia soli]|uniref:Uncharacterized protein n=1 Tax=Dawidia soli TaxID=2782352 RepID=A0AAP2GKC2_9BACT|nr:hypothetical protein [Dawidia soli]MBT1688883.1 hypothetical protein [Dawidia soli]